MASPFQQQSLQRKFIYFGLVVALFTGSLLFRKLVINTKAEELRLRSVDQGEVALTDTAMRLSLGGLRGLAVTSLWLTAIEHQKRHDWEFASFMHDLALFGLQLKEQYENDDLRPASEVMQPAVIVSPGQIGAAFKKRPTLPRIPKSTRPI